MSDNALTMGDRLPMTEGETLARKALVAVVREALSGSVTFIEAAPVVLGLKGEVGGVADDDSDFMSFTAIATSTDDLPLRAQWSLWDMGALEKLEPEYEKAQASAAKFATRSCVSLIARFAHADQEMVPLPASFSIRPQGMPWPSLDAYPLAMLAVTAADIEALAGVPLVHGDEAGLGPWVAIGLQFESGLVVELVSHQHSPVQGFVINADIGFDPKAALDEIFRAFNMHRTDALWVSPLVEV